jgi:CRP-like cAMP-binding protein
MVEDIPSIADFLGQLAIFRGLDRAQLEFIAARLEMKTIDQGEKLFTQGQPGDNYYLIYSGKICLSRQAGKRIQNVVTLVNRDYFGEEALLFKQPRPFTATAEEPSQILCMDRNTFIWLLQQVPQVKQFLLATNETRRLSNRTKFTWLGKDETTYLIAQTGFLYLLYDLVAPLVLGWLALIFFFLSIRTATASFSIALELLGIALIVAGILWGIWRYIDWGNDYYIVTSQRVVWLEKIVGLYESRQEAPLDTIQAVDIVRDQLGRWFGFGDVIARTFTGQIAMRRVGFPEQLASLIEEHRERALDATHKREMDALEQTIRRRLGKEPPPPPRKILPPVLKKKPGVFQRLFTHFFTMRFEENGVITFRKHWILLVGKIWQPTLGFLFTVALLYLRLANIFTMFTTLTLSVICILLFAFFIGWWFYQYLDWSNDIYQVTKDLIIDIYRKPLGREDKKTAKLENIFSLEHERSGVMGLMFNYGDVVAMVGTAKFTFDGVFNPASVAQEIFEHMNRKKKAQKEAEIARERERIADWLVAYHNQTRPEDGDEIPPNFDLNTR